MTTAQFFEGYEVEKYLGIVCGNSLVGANLFKDVFTAVRDLIGGRARSYEHTQESAIVFAMQEMSRRARRLGADGILGVRLDCGASGALGMLAATCYGTAVVLRPIQDGLSRTRELELATEASD